MCHPPLVSVTRTVFAWWATAIKLFTINTSPWKRHSFWLLVTYLQASPWALTVNTRYWKYLSVPSALPIGQNRASPATAPGVQVLRNTTQRPLRVWGCPAQLSGWRQQDTRLLGALSAPQLCRGHQPELTAAASESTKGTTIHIRQSSGVNHGNYWEGKHLNEPNN